MKTFKTIAIGIIGLVTLASCSSQSDKKETSATVPVVVYSPAANSSKGVFLSGEVTAKQTAPISTRMMGYIQKIHVKPGDRVAAGQLLVSISNEDLMAKQAQVQAMITETEAAAKNAKKDYERFQTLREQNSVSDKELENVSLQHISMQSKVEMAQQQMSEVRAMLAYTNIRAPFSGVITQKMADEGSMANPGMPILVLEQSGELQVVSSVPEAYISHVSVGDSAQIEVKSMGKTITGKVSELSPSAYRSGGQYAMKLTFDTAANPHIHAGMYVQINMPGIGAESASDRILLDRSSIVQREQLTGVYVVNDQNQAILRWIRLGKEIGDQVEVLSGLQPEDRVVLKSEGKMYNGVKVSINS